MIAYVHLIVAVAALGLLGVFHKIADHRRCRPEAINLMIFVVAAVTMFAASLVGFGPAGMVAIPAAAWITALVCGFLASFATLQFQHGIRHGKISTSWLVINLSTALPTVLSIVLYKEAVTPRRALGLFLAVVALLILWLERAREERVSESAATVSVANRG
jgi:drug/metabolite transporter (DMT)-like permease